MKHPLQFVLNEDKRRSPPKSHEDIARELAEFEARGGVVKHIPTGATSEKQYTPVRRSGNLPGRPRKKA